MIELFLLAGFAGIIAFAGTMSWNFVQNTKDLRTKFIRCFFALALIGAGMLVTVPRLTGSHSFQIFGNLLYQPPIKQKMVALTFDDHPRPPFTQELLRVLDSCEVYATFFLVGKHIEKHPQLASQIVLAGHEVGNHSYSHARLTYTSMEHIQEQVEKAEQLIRDLDYSGPIPFRAPFGQKLILLPMYLRQTGRVNISWDLALDTREEFVADPNHAVSHLMKRVRPGSIILFHLAYKSNLPLLRVLPEMISKLRKEGYSFVTVSEMMAHAQEARSK